MWNDPEAGDCEHSSRVHEKQQVASTEALSGLYHAVSQLRVIANCCNNCSQIMHCVAMAKARDQEKWNFLPHPGSRL